MSDWYKYYEYFFNMHAALTVMQYVDGAKQETNNQQEIQDCYLCNAQLAEHVRFYMSRMNELVEAELALMTQSSQIRNQSGDRLNDDYEATPFDTVKKANQDSCGL